MATLPEIKKRIIIQREPNTSAANILKFIQNYDNLSLDDFPKMDSSKRQYIQEALDCQPNEVEQQEWEEIERVKDSYTSGVDAADALLAKLDCYVEKWTGSKPAEEHLRKAKALYMTIEQFIAKQREGLEQEDWERLDVDNNQALLDYLRKYPHTAHKNDIDDLYWSNLNKEKVSDIEDYQNNAHFSLHKNEAARVMGSLVNWEEVKNSKDIFSVSAYVAGNTDSPFADKAKLLLLKMKQEEVKKMKMNPSKYEVGTLLRFLSEGVFSELELINEDVLTENVLESLRDPEKIEGLPDIQLAIDSSVPECKECYTDVYFFGIPSTGKTCILMGLSKSKSLHINLAHGGGDYAMALQQYTEAGITVPATQMGFAATLEAKINDRGSNAQHMINLVEMAGEDFARKIAGNKEHIFDFDSMGIGVTELLKNDNKKVFFLIVDPTTDVIRYKRKEVVCYSEETGEPIYELVNIQCNQKALITKMVDLFAYPDNAEIMKKVDAIHIVITKADLLCSDPKERKNKALEMFKAKYDEIVEPLYDLCKEYNINVRDDKHSCYYPKLYTFSLGKFYVGGLYEYDPQDSNELVSAIKNSTEKVVRKSFFGKVKDKFN